jgi:hypothetical protein
MALLSSPRRRRRLIGLASAAASIILLLAVAWPGGNRARRSQPSDTHRAPAVLAYRNPATQPPSRNARAAARSVVTIFIQTAVLRQHVDRSWKLVTASFREGVSRAEWQQGAIPVVPYPRSALALVKWKPIYSYRNRLGYQVLFWPRANSSVRPATFDVEVQRHGQRWLVAYWAPAEPPRPLSAAPGDQYRPSRGIGPIWLLVPGVLLGLMVFVPLGVLMREWRRGRPQSKPDPAGMQT